MAGGITPLAFSSGFTLSAVLKLSRPNDFPTFRIALFYHKFIHYALKLWTLDQKFNFISVFHRLLYIHTILINTLF